MTLLSFVRATDRPESVAHLRSFCADVHTVPMHRSTGRDIGHLVRSLASQKPFLIGRDWVPEMADAAAKLVQSQQFDAIHADQLPMGAVRLVGQATGRETVHHTGNGAAVHCARRTQRRLSHLQAPGFDGAQPVKRRAGNGMAQAPTLRRGRLPPHGQSGVGDTGRLAGHAPRCDADRGRSRRIPICVDPEGTQPLATTPHPAV
ncbi:MAG: hypothetical protein R2856_34690 [Caldilineaceae bacterium]